MTYKPKYISKLRHNPHSKRPASMAGLRPKSENWTDDAVIQRDIKYAFLKHRAQAKYRKEEYTLTVEQWCELWTIDKWLCRGRAVNDLCLMMLDPTEGWHINNIEIVERIVYLERSKEYRSNKQ